MLPVRPPALDSEAFAAAAGPGSIWIVEKQAFTIQSARIIQLGAIEVQQTFQVYHHLDPLVLEFLVPFLAGGIEIELIFQTVTAPAFHAYPYNLLLAELLVPHSLVDILFSPF